MANLKRKQIYLDEESDRALKRLATTATHSTLSKKNQIYKKSDEK